MATHSDDLHPNLQSLEDRNVESFVNTTPQSQQFWLSDGNVVLETSTKHYRVHQSILCRHSTVVEMILSAALFSEKEDGLMHVNMQGSDRDWDVLLSVFYDTPSLSDEETGLIPFRSVQAILRLSRIYHFAQKEATLKQLKEVLPDTLDGWDNLFAIGNHEKKLRKFAKKHGFGLLCLVRELNMSRCLPMAYFICLRYRASSDILHGRDRLHGRQGHPEVSPTLPSSVQLRLLTGKEKINRRLFTHSLSWWHKGNVSVLCISKIKCNKAIKGVLQILRMPTEDPITKSLDPIHVPCNKSLLANLCQVCRPEATAAYNRGREKLFDELPSIFCGAVGGWDDSDMEDDF